jgi:nitronate monooxygenase
VFDFRSLRVPVVGAPMAGGPSTPELVAAVAEAGGFGFLAAGYLSADQLRAAIRELRDRTAAPFGVNVFVPERIDADADALDRYRELLRGRAASFGVMLPEQIPFTDDSFDAKVDLVVEESAPVVSFTFGCPAAELVDRLHGHDITVGVTVTTPAEAEIARRAGADVLCVQGPAAGGHRGTFHILDTPADTPLPQLLAQIHEAAPGVPSIAAGGIATGAQAAELLDLGAVAVQVGTLLLATPEAGTKAAHKQALSDPRFTDTVLTRAFSGRPARALRNSFTDEFSDRAPAAYPQVNTLTGDLRKAAAYDPQTLNLWAGTGFRRAGTDPAALVVDRLGRDIARARDKADSEHVRAIRDHEAR